MRSIPHVNRRLLLVDTSFFQPSTVNVTIHRTTRFPRTNETQI